MVPYRRITLGQMKGTKRRAWEPLKNFILHRLQCSLALLVEKISHVTDLFIWTLSWWNSERNFSNKTNLFSGFHFLVFLNEKIKNWKLYDLFSNSLPKEFSNYSIEIFLHQSNQNVKHCSKFLWHGLFKF